MRAVIGGASALVMGAAALFGVAAMETSASGAKAKANVNVSIKQINAEMYGQVSSPKPAKCAKNRTVWVWQQIGARGGGDDIKSFSDTTSKNNDGLWVWNTGNTGVEGRFYAKVGATPDCKKDFSNTIDVFRNP